MIVKAEISQLYNNGTYFNIINVFNGVGVWTSNSIAITKLYKQEVGNVIFFIQFKDEESEKDFEIDHKELIVIWSSKNEDI